jgi:cytochrome b561
MASDTQFRLAAYDSIGVAPVTRQSLTGLSVGYYIAMIVALVVGLLRFGRQLARNRAWMFFPIMAAYFTAIHMVFESQGKYHFMLVPLMCIFAALAASPAEVVAPWATDNDRPIRA